MSSQIGNPALGEEDPLFAQGETEPRARHSGGARRLLVAALLFAACALATLSIKRVRVVEDSGASKIDIAGVIQRDASDERGEERDSDRGEEPTPAPTPAPTEANGLNVSEIQKTKVATIPEGCYIEEAPHKLLSDGFNFGFEVEAKFDAIEDGAAILTSSCEAFTFTISEKYPKFKMKLINLPNSEGDGVEVTSTIPLEAGVPFHITVTKNLEQLCITVKPVAQSNADSQAVVSYIMDFSELQGTKPETCSSWSGSQFTYQMVPVGAVRLGRWARRLAALEPEDPPQEPEGQDELAETTEEPTDTEATEEAVETTLAQPVETTEEAVGTTSAQPVETTLTQPVPAGAKEVEVADQSDFQVGDEVTFSGGGNTEIRTVAGFGSILLNKPLENAYPAGTSVVVTAPAPAATPAPIFPGTVAYKQLNGDIPAKVQLQGVDYDKLMANEDLQKEITQAISETALIEGGWSLTLNNIEVTYGNTVDGTLAFVNIIPYDLDNIHLVWLNFHESQMSKTLTARLNEVPDIQEVCSAEPCNIVAQARLATDILLCEKVFIPRPYERKPPNAGCVGTTCTDICYPETKCPDVKCEAGMRANVEAADQTCSNERECMDTCCLTVCAQFTCPKSACGNKTSAETSAPSSANETCCQLPTYPCCQMDTASCYACNNCATKEEVCAVQQFKNDSLCMEEQAPLKGDCELHLMSTFDSGTGHPVSSTSVIYGGTRAFTGGFGKTSDQNEYRLWVWDISSGKMVFEFETETPVLTTAAAADSIHALSGTKGGKATVWNYVTGGPSVGEIGFDSAVVDIAGGMTWQNSYVTGDQFAVFWMWGNGDSFKAPRGVSETAEEQEVQALKDTALSTLTDQYGFTPEQAALMKAQLAGEAAPGQKVAEVVEITEIMKEEQMMTLSNTTAVVQIPGNSNFASGDESGMIRYFNLVTLKMINGPFKASKGPISAMATFASTTRVVVGGHDGVVGVYDVANGKRSATFELPHPVTSLVVVNNGRDFYAGSTDGLLRMYSIGKQTLLCTMDTGGGPILGLTASQGRILVSSADGKVRVYRL